jgi:phage-related baseplate assembly protein
MTSALDLSQLQAPSVIKTLDWEAEIAQFVADLSTRLPEWVGVFEGDAFRKICQSWAYRLVLKDEEHNRDARSLLIAYATGADLDHLLATYHRTQRLPGEGDESFRSRGQLAPEARADFGLTPGGYIFKIRTEFGKQLRDVRAIHRGEGRVEIRLLGTGETGAVTSELLVAVAKAFQPEDASASTDVVTVLPAQVETVTVNAVLVVPPGPDRNAVAALSKLALQAFSARIFRLNTSVYAQAVKTAGHVGPALTVRLEGLDADLPARPEVAYRLIVGSVTPEVGQ